MLARYRASAVLGDADGFVVHLVPFSKLCNSLLFDQLKVASIRVPREVAVHHYHVEELSLVDAK